MLINYELRNELSIFLDSWNKQEKFANKVIIISIILTVLQIVIGAFVSPLSLNIREENF